MRIVVFDDFRLGLLETGGIRDITDLVEEPPPYAAALRLNDLVARFDQLPLEEGRRSSPLLPLESVSLRPSSPAPRNFLAAPLNYADHGAEMAPSLGNGATARELGFFVKAAGSLSGASDPIELPDMPGRRFDYEGEIAVVIGREARGVPRERALEHVFGYTLIVDATMRMTDNDREERTMRKSFWTFSPCGPWIVTADEIPHPETLTVQLSVNGVPRQKGSLSDLIVDVPGLIELASNVLPLQPGDVIATGTPSGIGELRAGDEVVVSSEAIGEMRLQVKRRGW